MTTPHNPPPNTQARNSSPDFVGVDKLKEIHSQQISSFVTWAKAKDWAAFHKAHYDWWTYPIDEASSYGLKFTVFSQEIAALKRDAIFMNNFKLGLALLARSWGWDLEAGMEVHNTQDGQTWQQWGVRLYKACRSAHLFSCNKEANSLRKYGLQLLNSGERLTYNGRDYSAFFIDPPHQFAFDEKDVQEDGMVPADDDPPTVRLHGFGGSSPSPPSDRKRTSDDTRHRSRHSEQGSSAFVKAPHASGSALSRHQYVAHELAPGDARGFKGAGVLLHRVGGDGGREVLLGLDARERQFTLLGGKRDPKEAAHQTACREFDEESGQLLDPRIVDALRKRLGQVDPGDLEVQISWVPFGKYALFLVDVGAVRGLRGASERLPEQHRSFMSSGPGHRAAHTLREMSELRWVRAGDLERHAHLLSDFAHKVLTTSVPQNVFAPRPVHTPVIPSAVNVRSARARECDDDDNEADPLLSPTPSPPPTTRQPSSRSPSPMRKPTGKRGKKNEFRDVYVPNTQSLSHRTVTYDYDKQEKCCCCIVC